MLLSRLLRFEYKCEIAAFIKHFHSQSAATLLFVKAVPSVTQGESSSPRLAGYQKPCAILLGRCVFDILVPSACALSGKV